MLFIVLFIYFCGVGGAIAGCGSWMYRFNRERFRKLWFLFSLIIWVPIVNYCLMWECFKLYDKQLRYIKSFPRYQYNKRADVRVPFTDKTG